MKNDEYLYNIGFARDNCNRIIQETEVKAKKYKSLLKELDNACLRIERSLKHANISSAVNSLCDSLLNQSYRMMERYEEKIGYYEDSYVIDEAKKGAKEILKIVNEIKDLIENPNASTATVHYNSQKYATLESIEFIIKDMGNLAIMEKSASPGSTYIPELLHVTAKISYVSASRQLVIFSKKMTKILIPSSINIYVTVSGTSFPQLENWLGRKFVQRDYSAQIREAKREYEAAKEYEDKMWHLQSLASNINPTAKETKDLHARWLYDATQKEKSAKYNVNYWQNKNAYDRKKFYDQLTKDAQHCFQAILDAIAPIVIKNNPILAYECIENFENKDTSKPHVIENLGDLELKMV